MKKLLLFILAVIPVLPAEAQSLKESAIDAVYYRSIGPTRQGGRYVDFAVVDKNPTTFYAALATGGLWFTEDNGITFDILFEDEGAISIGDIAVDQNNPDIVWVGTGEANNSRTAYYGDGIYRSDDRGETWKNMGLPESGHIGRIIIHPDDSDIVWVAALGHLYSENEERGVYKTTNGGKSWKKVLDIVDYGKHIGVVDLAIDPTDPSVLYAAAYDKVRRPWTFNAGGPGSGIYKTEDGGGSWTELAGGLPSGMLGRIGIAVSPSNPETVYANIENNNIEGVSDDERYRQLLNGIPPEGKEKGDEVYRSDDKGRTWRKVSPDGEDVGGGPAYYYQQMAINPLDPDHVYVLGVRMWETVNGGKEWRRPFNFGGDNHAMWIDPEDPEHIMLGYDHGMGISYDGGDNWYHPDFKDVGQFVAVGYDMAYPYNVYGGMQDNGSVRGPSTKKDGSPVKLEDWQSVGGGDGMYNEVDPDNNRYLYNESQFGPIRRLDLVTGESQGIRYSDMDRWAWNAPIVISPHNSRVIYHAGNKVVRSANRGESWELISPDLTTNDKAKIQGTGNIQYCTIVTMDESPVREGLLWAGTDDGKVWVTKDGGEEWNDVTDNIPGHPGYWVSRVEPSALDAATAYVTVTGYRQDDFRPFVWKTFDYGESWEAISDGLPDEPLCVIREHPDNPELLFAGSTKAVYASLDAGNTWQSLRNNMPYCPVEDLKIHPRENDLIVATHGRSIWIADISFLSQLDDNNMSSSLMLFKPGTSHMWVEGLSSHSAYSNFEGESEEPGLPVYYYTDGSEKDPEIQIVDGERVIFNKKVKAEPGLHKFIWRHTKIVRQRTDKEKEQMQQMMERYRAYGYNEEDLIRRFGSLDHVMGSVSPGNYKIRLLGGDSVTEHDITVMKDHWY
ncbi:MAG: WD40/YVTN/BNR-like repeat-containing protein [Bacteroidales bacterium]